MPAGPPAPQCPWYGVRLRRHHAFRRRADGDAGRRHVRLHCVSQLWGALVFAFRTFLRRTGAANLRRLVAVHVGRVHSVFVVGGLATTRYPAGAPRPLDHLLSASGRRVDRACKAASSRRLCRAADSCALACFWPRPRSFTKRTGGSRCQAAPPRPGPPASRKPPETVTIGLTAPPLEPRQGDA